MDIIYRCTYCGTESEKQDDMEKHERLCINNPNLRHARIDVIVHVNGEYCHSHCAFYCKCHSSDTCALFNKKLQEMKVGQGIRHVRTSECRALVKG